MVRGELSSNWKKLQAQLKNEQSSTRSKKRRTEEDEYTSRSISKPLKKARLIHEGSRAQTAASANFRKPRPLPAKVDEATIAPKLMGAVHSQTSKPGTPASLALWANDNDISPESISEAYGLGSRNNSMLTATSVKPNEGLAKGVKPGKYVAIDCEMVGVGDKGSRSSLARVSIVDFHGQQTYDSYVRQREKVVDWRTWVSGITPKHMATARNFKDVQAQVRNILKGRILVGHDLRHDLRALELDHPLKDIRDTARFSGFKVYGHGPKPALRKLAREILGVEIQTVQHSSIEDARVTMLLFRKYKSAFDVEHTAHYPDFVSRALPPKSNIQTKAAKNKKKRRNERSD